MHMVDDFSISTRLDKTCNILLDELDDKLSILIKHQVPFPMFNGLHVFQSKYFIKILCQTYIDKICKEHEKTWMKGFPITLCGPMPLPTAATFTKNLEHKR